MATNSKEKSTHSESLEDSVDILSAEELVKKIINLQLKIIQHELQMASEEGLPEVSILFDTPIREEVLQILEKKGFGVSSTYYASINESGYKLFIEW